MRKWFKKVGHKGGHPITFSFDFYVQSLSGCNCFNMPLYIKWSKGRKTKGRTLLQFEDSGKVKFNSERVKVHVSNSIPASLRPQGRGLDFGPKPSAFLNLKKAIVDTTTLDKPDPPKPKFWIQAPNQIKSTLFWEEEEQRYQPKPLRISVERHLKNGKSTCMGHIDLQLTEWAEQEEPKNVKLLVDEGDFTGATLRVTICSKMLQEGAGSDDDDADDDLEGGSDQGEDDDQDQKPKGPTVEEYAKAKEERMKRIKEMEQREKERVTEEKDEKSKSRRIPRRQKTEIERYREAGLLCNMCEERLPKLKCHECLRETCEVCDIGLHSGGPMALHYREEIEPPELPPLPEPQAATGNGALKTKSFGEKVEHVMDIAKVSKQDARQYLEQSDWDVEAACEAARNDPNAVTKPNLKKSESKSKSKKKVKIVEEGEVETEEQKEQRLMKQRLKQQARVKEMLKKGKGSLPSEDGFSTDDGAGVGVASRTYDSSAAEETGPGEDDMDDIESDDDAKAAAPPPKRASRYDHHGEQEDAPKRGRRREQENEDANTRSGGRRGVYKAVDNDAEASSSRRTSSRRDTEPEGKKKVVKDKAAAAAGTLNFFSFDSMLDAISAPLNRTCAAPRDNDWFQSMMAGKWNAEDSSDDERGSDADSEEAGASPEQSDDARDDNDFM